MARHRKNIATRKLEEAYKFQEYLLWELMGDNMGTKPKFPVPEGRATFPEKKAFLDTMFKGAEQGRKTEEDEEPVSGLDLLKRSIKNGNREDTSRGDFGGASEDYSDSDTDDSTDQGS